MKHLALLPFFLLACAGTPDDEDDDGDGGGRCDPADATGPTGTSNEGATIYQAGDVVTDVDLIGPTGETVPLYDMCGLTVMLVHGELG